MPAPMAKPMIVTLLVMNSVGHNFHGSWRHPRTKLRIQHAGTVDRAGEEGGTRQD